MSMSDSILRFIGSKWFTLVLGVILIIVLPFTWHNFQVVWEKSQLTAFWWIVAVFIINVISIGLCAYKFVSQLNNTKSIAQEEW
jgi:hypothetical protein